MTEIVSLTLAQLEDLFWTTTMSVLDYVVGVDDSKVRQSWPLEGAPAFTKSEDVTFLKLVEVEDLYNEDKFFRVENNYINSPPEVDPDQLLLKMYMTRVWEVSWNVYSNDAYDIATTIRDRMNFEEVRNSLATSNLFFVKDRYVPRRVPENFAGTWWQRVDLVMRFYELFSRSDLVNVVKVVDVNIQDGDDIDTILEIS